MVKKIIILSVVVGLAVAYYLYDRSSPQVAEKGWDRGSGRLHFDWQNLVGDLVAQSGEIKVHAGDLTKLASIKAFSREQNKALFGLVYEQFVAKAQPVPKEVLFPFAEPKMDIQNFLRTRRIPYVGSTKIRFNHALPKEVMVRIDGLEITKDKINFENVHWATLQTQVFRFKLKTIDKMIKKKVISAEAKKLGLSTREYKKTYIFEKLSQDISNKDIKSFMEKYQISDSSDNKRMAKDKLLDRRARRGVDYILERYVLELPIIVDLKRPSVPWAGPTDATPWLGSKDAELSVQFFGNLKSTEQRNLLAKIIDLTERSEQLRFIYHPVFPSKNGYQENFAKVHFCVWQNHKENFWSFFKETLQMSPQSAVASMIEKAATLGVDSGKLKKCLTENKSLQFVKDHLQSANAKGIVVGPVVVVGAEVYRGGLEFEDLKASIGRNLKWPMAGIW